MSKTLNRLIQGAMDNSVHEGRKVMHVTAEKLLKIKSESDARITELNAEVARLLEALDWIVKRPSSASENIARNAIAGNAYPPRKELDESIP